MLSHCYPPLHRRADLARWILVLNRYAVKPSCLTHLGFRSTVHNTADPKEMKRSYDDRRSSGSHDRRDRDRDRGRDEASYYRDPSSVLASGSSSAAALGSPPRRSEDVRREREHYQDRRRSDYRDERDYISSHNHSRRPELSSSYRSGTHRRNSRSRSRDRRQPLSRSSHHDPRARHTSRSMSPSQNQSGLPTSVSVREASPEEGE